jgi:ubiquinone biosynthesis protein COQ9
MIAPPERSPERDAAIEAVLPNVPFDGWTRTALRHAGPDADLLFPGGAADMIEAWCDLADRRMEEEAASSGLDSLRLTGRIRGLIALRLRQARPHREAARRAAAILALPRYAGLVARFTARTVDAIWHAAGDRSADFSWYTKRATLGAVYTATVLYWLRDTSEDDAATLAFLDRRLAGIGRIGALRGRIKAAGERLRPRRAA